jgi:N-acetylmuramoyl-L-alanine amidase
MTLQMLHKINAKWKAKHVFFFFMILINTMSFSQGKIYTIVLDAGHGGRDPGNIGFKKYKEKDIALKIVLEVGKILEAHNNVKVIYTRKTDVLIDLWVRGQIANKADADLFVSVHCNSHGTEQPSGASTFALGLHANDRNLQVVKKENEVILLEDNYEENYKGFDPNSVASIIGIKLMQEEYLDQSLTLANIVQNNMVTDLKRKDRGVKQAGFVVLHHTYMPSILIETGFLSNKAEGAYLNSAKVQSKYANSIAQGISTYINQVALNSVVVGGESKNSLDKPIMQENVVFKVQIATGSKKLVTKSYNFKGLKNVERIHVGNGYKYYFGKTSSYEEVKNFHREVRLKGYKTAFIVASKDGKKISIQEAIKTP